MHLIWDGIRWIYFIFFPASKRRWFNFSQVNHLKSTDWLQTECQSWWLFARRKKDVYKTFETVFCLLKNTRLSNFIHIQQVIKSAQQLIHHHYNPVSTSLLFHSQSLILLPAEKQFYKWKWTRYPWLVSTLFRGSRIEWGIVPHQNIHIFRC